MSHVSNDGYLIFEQNSSFVLVRILYHLDFYWNQTLLSPPPSPLVLIQVTYVLQEDLGVLSTLPGDTFSLFHLMASDLVSAVGSATDLLLGLGETCFSGMYHCTSSMLGALCTSCHTGVTGVGTLAGDTVGIFGGAVDNAWWVTRLFGGRLWEHSEGYVGAVVSEMGGQVKAVGGGLGRLAWGGGNVVGNVVGTGGGLITGTVEAVIAAVKEAFGEESD